jgi:sugar phosphate isomerase/epimerase
MKNQFNMEYPSLHKSYKGMFPFKIATTSFIYPDHYIPNVKMLGPYVDEIELLLFESTTPDALPSRKVVAELGLLSAEFNLRYNIHLPTDVSLCDPNPKQQAVAVETIARVIDLVNPLAPSALVLHLPYHEKSFKESAVGNWQHRVFQNLNKLISTLENRNVIAIETLDYPLELLEDIIIDLDLSICLDLGHLMVYGYDVLNVFERFAFRTAVLHLHGVDNGRDHLALEQLPGKLFEPVLQILNQFTGVVSLEVFSFNNLVSSLKYLECHWKNL